MLAVDRMWHMSLVLKPHMQSVCTEWNDVQEDLIEALLTSCHIPW